MICRECRDRADRLGGCSLDPASTCKAQCDCQHRGKPLTQEDLIYGIAIGVPGIRFQKEVGD